MGWRGIAVSRQRQCPRCRSRRIFKVYRFVYKCDDCRQTFHGFRLGPIRLGI